MKALIKSPTVLRVIVIVWCGLCLAGCHSSRQLVCFRCPENVTASPAASDREKLRREWDQWAQKHLQSGDVLFGMGDARAFFGLFPFSKVSSKMADSHYSHTGMISKEDGAVYVYDMAPEGARRIRFSEYLLDDKVVNLAIKRVDPEFQHCTEQAVEFCQNVYREQPIFDRAFRLDDDRLYCTELTVLAYRSAGLELCRPIRVDEFPNYKKFPMVTFLARHLSAIRPDTRVFTPGNDRHGVWSSPHLHLVYEDCRADLDGAPPAIHVASLHR